MKTWAFVREERTKKVGNKCEVCGKQKRNLLGHHIIPRSIQRPFIDELKKAYPEHWQEVYDSVLNHSFLCRIRCFKCEQEMHRLYSWGNGLKDQEFAEIYFRGVVNFLRS